MSNNALPTVEICVRMDDGRWQTCGTGYLDNGRIDDCPADLGEDVYDELADAIDGDGEYTVTVGDREFLVTVASEAAHENEE